MAWIESHQNLRDHPKTLRLERALHVTRTCVIGHLHVLWWWAMDYAQDGDLSRFTNAEIAAASLWPGDADEFCQALESAGFVSANPLQIHDWMDYCGKLIARRQKNAIAMKASRAQHVDNTCRATVPNPTVPNQTIKRERAAKAASPRQPSFAKPTFEEVRDYINAKDYQLDPVKWYAHYEANGWRVGKNPMRDWKAAVITWTRKDEL